MKYEVKIVKSLITDNYKNFTIGEDIAFDLNNKGNIEHYIGEIKDISNKSLYLKNVERNKESIPDEIIVNLRDIVENSCSYVFYD